MYGYDHFGMGWGLGGIWMILIWLVPILLLLILAFNYFKGERGDGRRNRAAMDILDERYARGEIDREEYLKRREDLSA
ncbi:MAG: SHOCT domain-containing protein [Thiobacillaceae bacterium]|jgi:putative membrane protein